MCVFKKKKSWGGEIGMSKNMTIVIKKIPHIKDKVLHVRNAGVSKAQEMSWKKIRGIHI